MANIRFTTTLILCMLAGNEAFRMKSQVAATAHSCASLKEEIANLEEYLPSKINKVESKGVGGVKGMYRIVKLARKANTFASLLAKFQEAGCEGDLTQASASLESAADKIAELTSKVGHKGKGLHAAMMQAEARIEALKAAGEDKQKAGANVLMAAFMKSIMTGGKDLTAEQEAKIEAATCDEQDSFLDKAIDQEDDAGDSLLEASEESVERHVQLLQANSTQVATRTEIVGLFLDTFFGLGEMVAEIVLMILGLVWFVVKLPLMIAGVVLFPLAMVATGFVCMVWFFLGMLVDFASLGLLGFGYDVAECHEHLFWIPAGIAGEMLWENRFWHHDPHWDDHHEPHWDDHHGPHWDDHHWDHHDDHHYGHHEWLQLAENATGSIPSRR